MARVLVFPALLAWAVAAGDSAAASPQRVRVRRLGAIDFDSGESSPVMFGRVDQTPVKTTDDDAAVAAPPPPGMSAYQAEYMAGVQTVAEAASTAATPFVLKVLADPTFRAGLAACCPSVSPLDDQALLEAYRAETRLAEMTHNFDVNLEGWDNQGGGNFLGDPNLGVYSANWTDHFYNLWEVAYLNITRYSRLEGESGAEVGLFGFKSFTNCSKPNSTRKDGDGDDEPVCLPATMAEAANRPVYTGADQSSPNLQPALIPIVLG